MRSLQQTHPLIPLTRASEKHTSPTDCSSTVHTNIAGLQGTKSQATMSYTPNVSNIIDLVLMDLAATAGIIIILGSECRARAIHTKPATSDYREALLDFVAIISELMLRVVTMKIVHDFCRCALPQLSLHFLLQASLWVGKAIFRSISNGTALDEALIWFAAFF